MFKKAFAFIFVLGFLLSSTVTFCENEKNKIRLIVPNYAPFTYEEKGVIQGLGIELLDKVMKELKVQYTLSLVPTYGRALINMKEDMADGFFLASQNNERDEAAVLSMPLAINRWCWFFLVNSNMSAKDKNFKTNAKVGSILDSNPEIWLKDNGYTIAASPNEASALPQLLKANRINTIFGPELVIENVIKKSEKNLYKKEFQVGQNFGIYISKKYLSNNPGFMEQLNGAIKKVIKL